MEKGGKLHFDFSVLSGSSVFILTLGKDSEKIPFPRAFPGEPFLLCLSPKSSIKISNFAEKDFSPTDLSSPRTFSFFHKQKDTINLDLPIAGVPSPRGFARFRFSVPYPDAQLS